MRDIPAFLSIDVEPDGFQSPNFGWSGLEASLERIGRLRLRLIGVRPEAPAAPQFGWYLRMDPQLEAVYGRPDHVVAGFGDAWRSLQSAGDVFGAHVHPLRWDESRGRWVHEFADHEWMTHCLDVSFDAYVKAFGERPVRHRYGVGYLNDHLVEALDQRGVTVDLTAEPGTRPRAGNPTPDVASGVDAAPRTAPATDCSRMPRRPYRPSWDDFRRPGGEGRCREITLLPLSSTLVRAGHPRWRQAAGVAKRRAWPEPQVMRMAGWTRSPKLFWDRAARHLQASRRPFLSLALRTDAPGSAEDTNTWAVLDHLPLHPLARRLTFVDPAHAVEALR